MARRKIGRKIAGFAKKVGGRALKAAGGVARGVLAGKGLSGAVRGQLNKELASIIGQGAYHYGRQMAARKAAGRRGGIRGRGDYGYDGSQSIMNPATSTPRIHNETGNITLKRSEYLGDVISGPLSGSYSSFNNETYYVNPGLDLAQGGSSSWLAPIGASFQQYRYTQLVYEYRSTSGNAVSSTNAALGTVIMCAQYDASKPSFPNKQQMMDSQFAESCAPSCSKMFPIECKPSDAAHKLWDIRTGALTSSQSQNTYDFVNFQIATQGCQAASVNLGELWVHYTVVLEKTTTNNVGTIMQQANYTFTSNITGQGTAPTASSPLGNTTTKIVPAPGNRLPLTFIQAGSNTAQVNLPDTIQQGLFLFEFYWRGTSTASLVPPTITASASGNCALNNVVVFSPNAASQASAYSTPSATSNILYASVYLQITAGGLAFEAAANGNGVILSSGGTFPATCTDLQIFVSQQNPLVVGAGL